MCNEWYERVTSILKFAIASWQCLGLPPVAIFFGSLKWLENKYTFNLEQYYAPLMKEHNLLEDYAEGIMAIE